MTPLLKINEPQRFASGLWLDTPPNQPALWTDGENVLFRDGVVAKSGGYTEEASYTAIVTGLETANVNGTQRVYVGAGPKVFRRDGGAEIEIGSGFSANGDWQFEPYGTFLLATNNVNPPQIWENGGQLVPWPTCPFARARLVRKLEIFPVLFSGQEAAWPSYNDYKDFVPGPGKRAGRFFIRDLDGEVMAAEPLGNALVYYSRDMFGFMTFIGGESTFSFRTQQGGGIGAVGPKAVVPAGAFHFGVSRKGLWQSDGNSFNYVLKPIAHRWFMDQVDWLRAIEIVGVHYEEEQQVAFFFPCTDGEIRGIGYNYAGAHQGAITRYKMPITAYADQGVLQAPLVGTGQSFGLFDFGDNAGSAPLPSSLVSAPLDMGSSDRIKRWQKIEFHYEVNGDLEVRVGYSNKLKDAPEWQDWRDVTFDFWLEDRESNYITLEFRSTSLGTDWSMSGLEIYGKVTGRNR